MEIRETSLSFPVTRGSGPRTASATLVFPRQVNNAVASIRGYQVGFVGDDHHVGLLQVELETQINANVVIVNGRLGCRDWSGNWDDEYNGSIMVGVLCDLVSATAPPPRGDLQITDLEINQAVQFFRSSEHLDAANSMPDNSLPLVGGKTTGLRFYVDHDLSVGSPITVLSGELTIRSGGATTTLTPIQTITPRRESEINRAAVDHTLNFAIPAAWSRGRLEISCQVFDAANPASRSAAFKRTLQFVDVNPLRVYGVGINYTGGGLNLAPPALSDILATFDYTRRVWPTGDVLTSGFTTIAFGGDLSGVAADGCGDGFNDLLDELQDMKGDTDDLVYGLLPTGTPLTGVAGCGGNGAGTGVVGDGVTAAHEASHAFGRKHVPCDDSSRCDSPRNTDDDYPSYGNYLSDSTGEFGFDPENNIVFDPAVSSDFMGYSGNDWISPYTFKALFSKGDPVGYSAGLRAYPFTFAAAATVATVSRGTGRAEWIKRRIPLLFLSLLLDGEKVTLRPSFTYNAYIKRQGPDSGVEIHLEGPNGGVLACVPLQQSCGSCDVDCGPMRLHGEVPWHESATRLVVRRDGRDLATYPVEDRPALTVRCERDQKGDIKVTWSARGKEPLWYLVQWCDRDGTWRGVAPRTQEEFMVVPARFLWANKDILKIRVLAVHLLNTAIAECDVEAHRTEPPNDILIRELPGGKAVRATVVDPVGRSLPASELSWYDEKGAEIARGSDLLRSPNLSGIATVRPVAQGVIGAEGYVLLNPVAEGQDVCSCKPAGKAAEQVLKTAGFPHHHAREDHYGDR
jgi:hypothetical protein